MSHLVTLLLMLGGRTCRCHATHVMHAKRRMGRSSVHPPCTYLRKVPSQVAEGQRSSSEVAQWVSVPQCQVKETWMTGLCTV
jgi:hypothetical protein